MINYNNFKIWAPIIAISSVAMQFMLYGTGINMGGDQSTQIVAGIAYADEGGLLISPDHLCMADTEIKLGEDYRLTLYHFPPGY